MACFEDSTLRFYDVATRAELPSLRKTDANLAVMTADGKRVYRNDPTNYPFVAEFDVESGKLVTRQGDLSNSKFNRAIAVSPDGSLVATITEKNVILWDAVTRKEIHRLEGHDGTLAQLYWSPDGKTLVGFASKQLIFWDVASRQKIQSIAPSFTHVGGNVAFSPDGQQFVLGGNRMISLYPVAPGPKPLTIPQSTYINRLAVHPNGTLLASTGIWATSISFTHTKDGPYGEVKWPSHNIARLAFTPEGRHLVVANGNGTLYVLRLSEVLK